MQKSDRFYDDAIYKLYDPYVPLIYRKRIHNVLRDKMTILLSYPHHNILYIYGCK